MNRYFMIFFLNNIISVQVNRSALLNVLKLNSLRYLFCLISFLFFLMHIITQNTSMLLHELVHVFFFCQEWNGKHLWEIMVEQIRLAKSQHRHIPALVFENCAKEVSHIDKFIQTNAMCSITAWRLL